MAGTLTLRRYRPLTNLLRVSHNLLMISKKVHDELMSVRRVLHYLPVSPSTEYGWTTHERQLFWMALDRFPRGPWTVIAEFISTKSTRQAMTHGQKLRQKLKRWVTRLHRNPAARSLMDEVVSSISTSTVSVATEISVAVSTPRSLVMPPAAPSNHGPPFELAPSRPNVYEDERAACAVVEDKLVNLPGPEGPAYTSASLQMLFDPHASVLGSAVAADAAGPLDLGETKHEDATDSAMLYPISKAAVPERSLLDELADALWNDHVGESK